MLRGKKKVIGKVRREREREILTSQKNINYFVLEREFNGGIFILNHAGKKQNKKKLVDSITISVH